jgi:hypothetical protein
MDFGYDYEFTPQASCATAIDRRRKMPVGGSSSANLGGQPLDIGPYARFPNRFFGSGMAARLGPSTGFVYVALCDHANRNSSNTFKVSDRALAADTRIASRTICDARKRLIEYGLISCRREKGQSHVYTLFKPSWEWKPLKERHRRSLKPRALHASPAPQV